jgi:hypothetical protein
MIVRKTDVGDQLASLFREAGNAHHKAFASTNGDDPEWPIWYAEFLQPRVNHLLSMQWTKSDVVYLLIRSEKERSAIIPQPGWPEFYSKAFINELQSARR